MALLTCPKCGHQTFPGTDFCENCGAAFDGSQPGGTAGTSTSPAPQERAPEPAAGSVPPQGLGCGPVFWLLCGLVGTVFAFFMMAQGEEHVNAGCLGEQPTWLSLLVSVIILVVSAVRLAVRLFKRKA